jgi:xanthine phosphoribosyltransferase
MKAKNISWNKLVRDMNSLSDLIPKNKFKAILCITKGGLIPAYYLGKNLGISVIETMGLKSYHGTKRGNIELKKLPVIKDSSTLLIVDDLVDSGATLQYVKKYFKKAKTAVIYKKPTSTFEPTYWLSEQKGWVNFPYEI